MRTYCRPCLRYSVRTECVSRAVHRLYLRGVSSVLSNSEVMVPRVTKNCESLEFFVPLFAIPTRPRWLYRRRGWISSSKGSKLEDKGQVQAILGNSDLRRKTLHRHQFQFGHQFGRGNRAQHFCMSLAMAKDGEERVPMEYHAVIVSCIKPSTMALGKARKLTDPPSQVR